MKNTIVWMASILHLVWAFLLIVSPAPTTVTGLNLLYTVIPNRFVLAGLLILSSIMAMLAIYKYSQTTSLVLLLLQQAMLIIPAIAVIQVISHGQFADGVVRPRAFLTADKISVVLLALFHSLSLIQFHKLDEGN